MVPARCCVWYCIPLWLIEEEDIMDGSTHIAAVAGLTWALPFSTLVSISVLLRRFIMITKKAATPVDVMQMIK